MKSLHWVILFLCLIAGLPSTLNAKNFVCSSGCKGASLIDPVGGGSNDYQFNNQLKLATSNNGWAVSGNPVGPPQMDNFGWLLTAAGTPFLTMYTASQAVREGHYVQSWTGSGKLRLSSLDSFGTVNNVACTGAFSGGCDNTSCNTGTVMQGYIVGTTLNVTTLPPGGAGCALVVGQPISNNSAIISGTYNSATGAVSLTVSNDLGVVGPGATIMVTGQGGGNPGLIEQLNGNFTTTSGTSGTTINFTAPTGLGALSITATGQVASIEVNQWGTPTIIIGMSGSANCLSCTGTGGLGTYLINYSENIANSGSPINISPGGRNEVSFTGDSGATPFNATQSEWEMAELTTTAGNPVQWIGFPHINDESSYDSGALVQSDYIARMEAAGFSVTRDLGITNQNGTSNCALWQDRKSPKYYSYNENEFRPSMWAGAATYALDANDNNNYTITFNGGALFDKETVIFQVPSGGSTVATTHGISVLGNASSPLTIANPGSGYTDGYYPHAPLIYVTSGAGTGAQADIVVKGGVVTLAWLRQPGINYTGGDSLTVSTSIIGAGSGFSVPVTTISNGVYGVQISIDGGVTYAPLLFDTGGQVSNGQIPLQNTFVTAKYDATFHGWLFNTGVVGLFCRFPPEVEVALAVATNEDPAFVEPWMAMDPITDWPLQEAYYINTNYPQLHAEYQTPNELFNFNQQGTPFAANRAQLYAAMDPVAWTASNGTLTDREVGKVGSLLGQEIYAGYGGNTSRYVVTEGVQTANGNNPSQNNERLLSKSWVNQTSTLIPVQPNFSSPVTVNFTQQAAWKTTNRIDVTNYWQPMESTWFLAVGAPQEVQDAYNWVTGNASTRNTIMASYMDTTLANLSWLQTWYTNWNNWATTCAGAAIAPTCPITGIDAYEGGNSTGNGLQTNDNLAVVVGFTPSTTCTLTLQAINIEPLNASSPGTVNTPGGSITSSVFTRSGANTSSFGMGIGALLIGTGVNTTITGYNAADSTQSSFNIAAGQGNVGQENLTGVYGTMAVQGMPITLTAITESGGTAWATLAAAGNLTVGAPAAVPQQNLTIYQNGSPIDCSSYNTLTKATVTYVGSANWVNTLRTYSYYWSGMYAQIQQVDWQNFKAAGGVNPAQSNFGSALPWSILVPDSFGYFQLAACTSCTITNGSGSVGNILTLGGTVTGEFQVGQVLFGRCVTNPASSQNPTTAQTTVTALLTGTGHSSGDTLQVSQNSTCTTAGTVTGTNANTIPSYNYEKAFNHGAGWLLKRDLDPANNDNSPAFLDKAA